MIRLHLIIPIITIVLLLSTIGCGGSNGNSSVNFDRTNYDLLLSDPDKYKGANIDIIGRVFAAPERNEEGTYWQMYADPINGEWNTAVGIKATTAEVSIKNGDYVHVTGTVTGEFQEENMLGGEIRGVIMEAKSATVLDASAFASYVLASAPPALHVYTGEPDIVLQQGVTLTLEKIEFAESETRAFLTLANNSESEAGLREEESKAIQGKTQFNGLGSWQPNYPHYPELQDDLITGIESSGVVVFPPLDPSVETKFYFDVYNYSGFLNDDFVFVIPAK